jgi:hypothetical protein
MVVEMVVVNVASLHTWRAGANEGFQYEVVNHPGFPVSSPVEFHPWILRLLTHKGVENLSRTFVFRQATDPTPVGNFILPDIALNRFPPLLAPIRR